MQRHQITANPFALLMNPEAVHAALAQSSHHCEQLAHFVLIEVVGGLVQDQHPRRYA